MVDPLKLKEKFILAGCCQPSPENSIVGYNSFDDVIKVHEAACSNLVNADTERLVRLAWSDVLAESEFMPGEDFDLLDATDFAVLKHHRDFDIDYSLKLAAVLRIDKQEAFERHKKLCAAGLLERVPAVMVRYRKNTAQNKCIKHRNHTYYRLTDRGINYLEFYLKGPEG